MVFIVSAWIMLKPKNVTDSNCPKAFLFYFLLLSQNKFIKAKGRESYCRQ